MEVAAISSPHIACSVGLCIELRYRNPRHTTYNEAGGCYMGHATLLKEGGGFDRGKAGSRPHVSTGHRLATA
eukprot:3416201-Rhodomonas_salina.1